MEDFNISQGQLFGQFRKLKNNNKKLKCAVLFPDGTIIDGHISLVTNNLLLVIVIHGVEFQDWVGFGMSRFEKLKFKILEETGSV